MLNVLTYVLVGVQVLCAILLLSVILIQKTRGQGMVAFGAGMGESLFGAQMGNVLTRTTVILAVIFLTNSLVLSLLASQLRRRTIGDTIGTTPAAPAVPGGPGGMPPGPVPAQP